MANDQSVLLGLAQQMYEDIKFITSQNPTQVVDEDTTRIFNHLLNDVKQGYMNVPQVFAFEAMSPRTLKYKDALVVAGQVYRLLALVSDGGAPAARPQPRPAPQQQGAPHQQGAPPQQAGSSPNVPRPVPGGSSASIPRQSGPSAQRPKEPPTNHDHELYGEKPPPKLNDDGTVPFSLLDEEDASEPNSPYRIDRG